MSETKETRIKRLRMRSMRRGIKEMDLLLSAFADENLAEMSDANLDLYEQLLDENDHDLLQWTTGHVSAPSAFAPMIETISQTFQK